MKKRVQLRVFTDMDQTYDLCQFFPTRAAAFSHLAKYLTSRAILLPDGEVSTGDKSPSAIPWHQIKWIDVVEWKKDSEELS